MEYKDYNVRGVTSYFETLNKKAIFLKQQGLKGMSMEALCKTVQHGDMVKVYSYDFVLYEMKNAFEPFMSWIKQAYYEEFSTNDSVEEFVEKSGVYSLQREIFCSYISTGICERKLEVMMNEYDYEEERIMESIYSSLRYIAGGKTLVLAIGKIHMAPQCVLRFLNMILNREDQIRFVFTYGETFLVKEYCQNEWAAFMQKAEEDKLILTVETNDILLGSELPDKFNYKESEIGSYILFLNNMVHLHAFGDARYYFDSIMNHIYRIDSGVSDADKFKILELLGRVYLGMGDYKDALLVCEKMVPLFSNHSNLYREYVYYYFSAKAHLLMKESALTLQYCSSCRPLAEKMKDELLLMNIDVVETVAELGGLKELFRCDYSYQIKESLLERAKKAGYENFLAYMYVFGYENDKESMKRIGRGDKEPVYFNKGIEIAKRLDNKNLLLGAYMKNIILYSDHGYYKYVRELYEKRLEIIGKDDAIRVAHTYAGLGYIEIVLEDYEKADEYLRKSLDLLIEGKRAEDIAEVLYNMFVNCYAAGANEGVIECINLLIKVMKIIRLQGLKVCNASRIYGMLALAYYKQGEYFDSHYCVGRMEAILSYILNKNDEREEELWYEDLFLYHLCKANLYSYEDNLEKAAEHFELSRKYMEKHEGIKYYSYKEYAIFKGQFLEKKGLENERTEVLHEAYEYCINHDYHERASCLRAELDHTLHSREVTFQTAKLPAQQILDVCLYIGAKEELKNKEKDIDFLTLCHNIMMEEENGVQDVVNRTMDLIRNTFSFDRILFVERNEDGNSVAYVSGNVSLNQTEIADLYEFFDSYKVEFMAGRLDKSFKRYKRIVEKLGGNDVAMIVGIPLFSGGLLKRFFVAAVDVHRSFTENRSMPDQSNLAVIKCAISQMDVAIERIKNSSIVRIMNRKLEKAAYTDQLTGIFNRMGFDKILGDNTADTGVLLYMDLDYFKKYNDTYGHSIGDIILKGFAGIIHENVRTFGYAIRYGGDEFVAVLPEKDELYAERIAEAIQYRLREDDSIRNVIDGQILTSSVGIATYESADWTGLERALQRADKALYYVKQREKGRIARWSQVEKDLQ